MIKDREVANTNHAKYHLRSQKAAADPVSVLPGSLGRGSWCNEHDTIHERLDIIEEKVIKTVEHLESEVKSLLDIISETTSNIPIAPGTPLIDIFDGKYLVG
ncbi:PREDICTED: placenta-specific protein 9 [Pterocles gutturalis]|nr:PREDICTED: placenta-specific protein 9 [Pterocles gutturalis]